jgi:hypothetical protein
VSRLSRSCSRFRIRRLHRSLHAGRERRRRLAPVLSSAPIAAADQLPQVVELVSRAGSSSNISSPSSPVAPMKSGRLKTCPDCSRCWRCSHQARGNCRCCPAKPGASPSSLSTVCSPRLESKCSGS